MSASSSYPGWYAQHRTFSFYGALVWILALTPVLTFIALLLTSSTSSSNRNPNPNYSCCGGGGRVSNTIARLTSATTWLSQLSLCVCIVALSVLYRSRAQSQPPRHASRIAEWRRALSLAPRDGGAAFVIAHVVLISAATACLVGVRNCTLPSSPFVPSPAYNLHQIIFTVTAAALHAWRLLSSNAMQLEYPTTHQAPLFRRKRVARLAAAAGVRSAFAAAQVFVPVCLAASVLIYEDISSGSGGSGDGGGGGGGSGGGGGGSGGGNSAEGYSIFGRLLDSLWSALGHTFMAWDSFCLTAGVLAAAEAALYSVKISLTQLPVPSLDLGGVGVGGPEPILATLGSALGHAQPCVTHTAFQLLEYTLRHNADALQIAGASPGGKGSAIRLACSKVLLSMIDKADPQFFFPTIEPLAPTSLWDREATTVTSSSSSSSSSSAAAAKVAATDTTTTSAATAAIAVEPVWSAWAATAGDRAAAGEGLTRPVPFSEPLRTLLHQAQWLSLALHRKSAWFLPDVTPEQAVALLEGQEDGSFIVHWSARPACLGLTVAHDALESPAVPTAASRSSSSSASVRHAAILRRATIVRARRAFYLVDDGGDTAAEHAPGGDPAANLAMAVLKGGVGGVGGGVGSSSSSSSNSGSSSGARDGVFFGFGNSSVGDAAFHLGSGSGSHKHSALPPAFVHLEDLLKYYTTNPYHAASPVKTYRLVDMSKPGAYRPYPLRAARSMWSAASSLALRLPFAATLRNFTRRQLSYARGRPPQAYVDDAFGNVFVQVCAIRCIEAVLVAQGTGKATKSCRGDAGKRAEEEQTHLLSTLLRGLRAVSTFVENRGLASVQNGTGGVASVGVSGDGAGGGRPLAVQAALEAALVRAVSAQPADVERAALSLAAPEARELRRFLGAVNSA